MRNLVVCILLSIIAANTVWAASKVVVKPYAAQTFVKLPETLSYPEGITLNPETGDLYVGTFNVPNPVFNLSPVNAVLRYSEDGTLLAKNFFAGPTPLVGLTFNLADNYIYIAVLGDITGTGSKIVRLPADFDENTSAELVADIPFIGAPADRVINNLDGSTDTISFSTFMRVPNDIIFNQAGDLLVSDSFQGAVFHIPGFANCTLPCSLEVLVQDGMLATGGHPSFGANGIALNQDESSLFVGNTGDDRILKIDMVTKAISVFAESINGPDGIKFDEEGRLWITANQADKVIGLDTNGKVIAKLGDFLGMRNNGTPKGLLFPGSLVIKDKKIYVTNLSIASTLAVMGDEPEEDVTRYTVSKIKIPNLD